jgi:predicted nucleotide-binding protein (sugar kinase/HSP70/actin superfamily)
VSNKKRGFEFIKEYKNTFKVDNIPQKYRPDITIGIPYGLYLSEEHSLWTYFFNRLGIKTISSEDVKDAVNIGKRMAKTEFCTPIAAFYGHVKYLSQKADYIFLPVYSDSREKEKDMFRHYCYYTQFATSLVSSAKGMNIQGRSIMPVVGASVFLTKVELYKALNPFLKLDYWSIVSAYDEALEFYDENRSQIRSIYQREKDQGDDINVVILGRPYVVLDNKMNKGIPGIFTHLDTKAFYHDMLTISRDDTKEIEPLLKAFHWNYTAKILSAALIIAKTRGLYPVYMSSFKCSPDSFALEYFKRIMDDFQKPYIILDLDEHGSNVGYETRIEAAISAFKNHYAQQGKPKTIPDLDKHESNVGYGKRIEAAVRTFKNHFAQQDKPVVLKNYLSVNPETEGAIGNKTLLFPSWDNMTLKLIEAVLIKEGIDARVVPLTEHAIQLGLRTNTGQCLPVNIVYQSFVDYIKEHDLDPSNTTVWMLNANVACNIRLYPYLIKSMFDSYGNGMEHVSVYAGNLSLFDISKKASIDAYFAYMLGGMLRKMGCKIRPYEKRKGHVDEVIKQSESIFYNAFLRNTSLEEAVVEVVGMFKNVRKEKAEKTEKAKVAILGDMFVRDNDIMNQQLIKCIEKAGGEVITTPLSDLSQMLANAYVRRWLIQGHFKEAFTSKGVMMLAGSIEKNYYKHFNEILQETVANNSVDLKFIMETFHVILEHAGESMDNLIAIFSLLEQYPDISLFVQTSPAFCCAGLITEAMSDQIESITGVPIVSITYDGTEKKQNDKLIPYIKLLPPKTLCAKNNLSTVIEL